MIEEAFHVGGRRVVHIHMHSGTLYTAVTDIVCQCKAVAAAIGSGVPTEEISVAPFAERRVADAAL